MKYLISSNTDIIRQEQASEWNLDRVLTQDGDLKKDLSGLPMDNESLVFFVPTVFDYSNSLSYEGANLALRILMHCIRNNRTDIAIVLMGNETESNFLLNYDYPNILKIPVFDYVRFNKEIIASYTPNLSIQLKSEEFKPYLDNLGLKIPSSFKSTHSLTNEWCLYKWNSFMGFNENTSSLGGLLYFDYLITIEKLNRIKNKTASDYLKKKISNLPPSRILVIDDKKGWHQFFNEMFASTSNVEIHCIGAHFNKLEFAEIEKEIISEVNAFKPHVIILDFRLMEDKDAEVKDDMKQISGYRVLAKILKGNYKEPLESFGRQVIIFTATSRIENILLLRDGNADGFVLKEKPENYNGKEITKDVISRMVSSLETAIIRADFLIPLNEKLDNLLDIINTTNNSKTDIGIAIDMASQSVRQLTQNNLLNEDILKIAFLDLFSILESLKDDKREKLFPFINAEASKLKLEPGIFVLWEDICEIRKCLAHGDPIIGKGKHKGQHVSVNILLEWTINLVEFILEFMRSYLKN